MSTLTLYEIAAQYHADAEALMNLDLDPDVVADTLEGMSGDLEVKAQSVAYVIQNMRASAEAIKAFEVAQAQRRKSIEARADHLLNYLSTTLRACNIEKVDGPGISITWRKSTAVVPDDSGMPTPPEYLRVKPPPEPEPDKVAIGAAIKRGQDVTGWRLEHRQNLQIKP